MSNNLPVTRISRGSALVPYRDEMLSRWDDPRRLGESVRGPFRTGMLVLVAFVGGLGYWSATVPLAGGALAPGVIAPEGSRRTVQHYEGGIVQELRVSEGEMVERGAPLLILGDMASQTKHAALLSKQLALQAKRARLEAEKTGLEAVSYPGDLRGQAMAAGPVAWQDKIFEARRLEFNARRQVLEQRLNQLAAQVQGYQALVKSQTDQLSFLREEAGAKERLLEKGFARLPDALRLRRMMAEAVGRLGELQSNIAAAEQKQMETRFELTALETERSARIAVEFDEVSNELRDVEERIRAAADVLKRSIVRAPVTGRVANLKVRTIGGVVRRGEDILDIVPSEERLLVEARLSPLDIDVVHAGLSAEVTLSAYAGSNTPRVKGTVLMISADSATQSAAEGEKPYYLARVAVDRSELSKIGENVRLTPGMPADVMIVTGERTMLNYLLQPFRDALDKSFRQAS